MAEAKKLPLRSESKMVDSRSKTRRFSPCSSTIPTTPMSSASVVGCDNYSRYSWSAPFFVEVSKESRSSNGTSNGAPTPPRVSNALSHAKPQPSVSTASPASAPVVLQDSKAMGATMAAISAAVSQNSTAVTASNPVVSEVSDTLNKVLDSLDATDSRIDGLKPILTTMCDYYAITQCPTSLKLADVTVEQFQATRNALGRWGNVLGKPRFSYFEKEKIFIVRWPSAVHEALIATLDYILTREAVMLPYPRELVTVSTGHNTELMTPSGGTHVPDICLQFWSKGALRKVLYPVICQVAFSQPFEDAQKTIIDLVKGYPSVQMAILLDVKESREFSSPTFKSTAWTRLSVDSSPLTLPAFIALSNVSGKTDNLFTEPIVVADHTWCSISYVNCHVWVRDPESNAMSIDGPGTYAAHGSMPNHVGMEEVENLVVQGLEQVKQSLLSLCEEVMEASTSTPAIDLGLLQSHVCALPTSFDAFIEDLKRGAEQASHGRYVDWFHKTFQGTKRAHEYEEYVPSTESEGSSLSSSNAGPSVVDPPASRRRVRCRH